MCTEDQCITSRKVKVDAEMKKEKRKRLNRKNVLDWVLKLSSRTLNS